MRALHDLRCTRCASLRTDVVIENYEYPRCERCGAKMTWMPSKLSTDVFGTPQYSDATGQVHSSQREKERVMAELGYHGKGDKDHGARPELSIRRSAFSYAGQKSKMSTGERYR